MNNFEIRVSGAKAEKPMRNILGMNNIPRISNVNFRDFERKLFDALNIKYVRFHDAPSENSAQMILDIHRVFPLFHLDENDERNYVFSQTDDYLAQLEGKDTEIDIRLGESIDHSLNGRLIGVPEDIEKWARICRNIVAHYKNGEMNGMHLNVTRVTVWEEPDNNRLFGGTVDDYSDMFCAVYRILKKDFPDILVGGPTMMTGNSGFLKDFIDNCQKQGIAPDFISSTFYSSISFIEKSLEEYCEILDSYGLGDTKISIIEWHMAPERWDGGPGAYTKFFETMNASFTCTALMQFMDNDCLDLVYYYAWACNTWSVMNLRCLDGIRALPVYYGLLLFQKLAAECGVRLAVDTAENENITCLAGMTDEGRLRLLVSCLDGADCNLVLKVAGAKSCSVRAVRENFCEEECVEAASLPENNGNFEFVHEGENGVYLFEFEL